MIEDSLQKAVWYFITGFCLYAIATVLLN